MRAVEEDGGVIIAHVPPALCQSKCNNFALRITIQLIEVFLYNKDSGEMKK